MITTKLLSIRAAQGDTDAQFRMGYRFAFGKDPKRRDWRQAMKYWQEAAKNKHPRAQFYLATCYDFALGVHRNIPKAMYWYLEAAKNGHDTAQFNIGFSFLNGQGLPHSPKKAIK